MDGSLIVLLLSGILFMRHMILEETPGHPYFVKEYSIVGEIKE